jgi:Bacterial EndoU nuclease
VIPAQFAVPLPPLAAPAGAGPADDGPDPAAKAAGAAVARAGRRASQVLTEIGQGHLGTALGHALLGRPYPAAVDDPAFSVLHTEAGGEGDAAPQTGGEGVEPAPERITVSPDRRRHILVGDKTGGGHRPGLGIPGKSEFPEGWTDDKIISEIEDVANDPNSKRQPSYAGRTEIHGTREGVDIEIILGGDGKTIVTAHPTNLPRNPKGKKS